MKVALVHDYLIRFGGAERVFLSLKKIFPKADIFTLLYNEKKMGKYFPNERIRASFLQQFPFSVKCHRLLAPLIPAAVESLDLRDYDLVISSSSAFIKGLILRPRTLHICYCHNPSRFLWDYAEQYQSSFPCLKRILFHYLRLWDRSAASRVDYFIANSKITGRRIRKYYGRESRVIYPPVVGQGAKECFLRQSGASGHGSESSQVLRNKIWEDEGSEWKLEQNSSPGNFAFSKSILSRLPVEYFLIVSQLTPYKRIDLAIDAFNKLELPLVIIGEGRDRRRLERMAGRTIRFLGWLTDEEVSEYYRHCAAFIFPGEDDFGIAPVEAMSCGKPVLAYRKGGATETVLEGISGEFFDDLAVESLADGVRRLRLNLDKFSPLVIRKISEKFSEERFERGIKEFVIEAIEEQRGGI